MEIAKKKIFLDSSFSFSLFFSSTIRTTLSYSMFFIFDFLLQVFFQHSFVLRFRLSIFFIVQNEKMLKNNFQTRSVYTRGILFLFFFLFSQEKKKFKCSIWRIKNLSIIIIINRIDTVEKKRKKNFKSQNCTEQKKTIKMINLAYK